MRGWLEGTKKFFFGDNKLEKVKKKREKRIPVPIFVVFSFLSLWEKKKPGYKGD